MNSDYTLIPCDELFAKIEDQLNSYSSTGILDIGRFYSEVRWCINKFGIAALELTDAIVKLENHKAEMPCDFFLLNVALLCDEHPTYNFITPQPQSRFIVYNREINEIISQNTTCLDSGGFQINQGVAIESCRATCNNEQVLQKVTSIDYVAESDPSARKGWHWHRPQMLTIRNKKSIKNICSKDCKNIEINSPYEISIEQQGNSYYIYSTMKKPIIYLKYYAFPIDLDTGLPLIPDNPTIQKAIEYHLMHYFFYMAWLNSDTQDIERKVKDLEIKRNAYMQEAINYTKIPSFQKSVEMANRVRRRFSSYEIMNSKHL